MSKTTSDAMMIAGQQRYNRRADIPVTNLKSDDREWWIENLRVHREGQCEHCNRIARRLKGELYT